jgi:iron complex transport system ATP-binding protein
MLRLEHISFAYRDQPVIRDVNLEIPSGCFLSLIGPNGSGKTTLLRLMSRVLDPQQGCVCFDGKALSSLTARDLAQSMAVISSEQFFEFPYPVTEIVAMGRYPYLKRLQQMSHKDSQVIDEALRLTDVRHLRNRPISHLSSGERQRVLIARAIAQQPKILILDEPNAHLDIHHQIAIFELLRSLNREHQMTIVAVLHDLSSAAAYSETIVLLHEGKVVKTGRPEVVITRELIHETYGVTVDVFPSPTSGFPLVAFAPKS